MNYSAEIFGSSIIVLGDFNPAIFSPDWLLRNKLIGEEDATSIHNDDSGHTLLISHEATSFQTKTFGLQVLGKQFTLSSKDALSPAFKDLAVSVFQLLSHTPVTAVGLNFMGHFKISSEEEYHSVGDALVPKAIWNEVFPDYMAGLADLTIRFQVGKRGEPLKSKDERRISVQPSNKVKFGVYLAYNDHHDVSEAKAEYPTSAERVAQIIDEEWEPVWKDANRAFDAILSFALGPKD